MVASDPLPAVPGGMGKSVSDLAFVPILMAAAFVHGTLGFGFPVVSTPLLALLMDLRAAILLTLIPTIAINLGSILGETHWRGALRRYWPIPAFTMVGSFLGTQVLWAVDPAPLRILLALVVMASLVSDWVGPGRERREPPAWTLALLGFLLGFAAGLVNIFSPLLVAYALYTRMDPGLMVATFNMSFLTSKSGQIAGFVSQSAFTLDALQTALWLLPLVLLSLWLGIRIRRRINVNLYKRLLRYTLWLVSLALIVDSLRFA